MSKNKKLLVGMIVCVTILIGLLLIAMLMVPKLVDSETVKERIRSELSGKVGAAVDFDRIDVSLFPTPHLFLIQPSAIWPQTLSVTADKVSVFPQLLPLLLGRVNITQTDIQHPELTVTLEKSRSEDDRAIHPAVISEWLQRIAAMDASQLPQLNCQIQNGRVTLVYDQKKVLVYDRLKANLASGSQEVTFTVSGKVSIADSLDISGRINPKDSTGQAHIRLAQVNAQSLFNAFFPEMPIHVKNARTDMRIDVDMHAPEEVQVAVDFSLPSLTLARKDETLAVNGGELTGRIDFSKDGLKATLTKLDLTNPRINLSGNLLASSKDARIAIQLKGRNIDVTATREMMLFLGGHLDMVGQIFDVLKSGQIPLITLTADSTSLADLFDLKNMVIRGQVDATTVHIPHTRADVRNISGEIVISRSSWQGKRLQAHLGDSIFSQISGSLNRDNQLDLDVGADIVVLDQLIQALKRVDAAQGEKKKPTSPSHPLNGEICFKADQFKFGEFIWNPLQAHIALKDKMTEITLEKALLCGISTPGTLKLTPSTVAFEVEPLAREQELEPSKTCFVGEAFRADGRYQLKGRIQGQGSPERLLETTTGQVTLTAVNGRIYHDIVLLRVFKFLNTLSILTGQIPTADMEKKGFKYHSYHMKVRMQKGRILIDEAVLKGAPLTLTASGTQDIKSGQLDLNLLATPLVALDRLFDELPLAGGVVESLDTIPPGIKGTAENIHIYPLAPSAVGLELETLMKKTVENPISILDPGGGA